ADWLATQNPDPLLKKDVITRLSVVLTRSQDADVKNAAQAALNKWNTATGDPGPGGNPRDVLEAQNWLKDADVAKRKKGAEWLGAVQNPDPSSKTQVVNSLTTALYAPDQDPDVKLTVQTALIKWNGAKGLPGEPGDVNEALTWMRDPDMKKRRMAAA